MHIKRKTMPKFWPVPKTGSKYLAVPSHEQRNAMPLILIMRDVLKMVKNKKELKKALNEKKIEVNGKIVREINYPVALLDSVSLPESKKFYRVVLENKRLALEPIKKEEATVRIFKIIGKKMLSKNKIQLNLNLGRNILSSEKADVGDFVMFDMAKNRIIRTIPLAKNTGVVIVSGKHIGKKGKISEITKEGENTIAKIRIPSGEEISSNVNNLFVAE